MVWNMTLITGNFSGPILTAWPQLSTWTPLTDHQDSHIMPVSGLPSHPSFPRLYNHHVAPSYLVFSSDFPHLLLTFIFCCDLPSDFTVNWSTWKRTPCDALITSNHPPASGPRSSALAPVPAASQPLTNACARPYSHLPKVITLAILPFLCIVNSSCSLIFPISIQNTIIPPTLK